MSLKTKFHLKVAKFLAELLDSRFKIFSLSFGLDPLLGLIPGVGDIVSAIFASYLVWIAYQMKAPREKLAEMVINILVDLAVSSIPVVGDIGDFAFKANIRNYRILEKLAPVNNFVEGEIV